jgi:UDP-glucose 4-epimerase
MKTILVTGGLGYIGSHICLELLENNNNLIIMDNLSNSSIKKLDIIKKYNKCNNDIIFYEIDLMDYDHLLKTINNVYKYLNKTIDVIIHLAGLKSVSESISIPIKYYENNLYSTINLFKIMEEFKINNFIFSSSSTVYGNAIAPYDENSPTGIGITNPYGRSKFIQEEMIKDISIKNKDWNIVILRYFNPIGHYNLDLKEEPSGIPNNLFPYLIKVYLGEIKELNIFGSDYDTRDGTCSRDFIHVLDLSNAHKLCCDNILNGNIHGLKIYNVGTGIDVTVLELINAFEKENNVKINYKFASKREGDLKTSFSNVNLIYNDLNWKSKYSIKDCVKLN